MPGRYKSVVGLNLTETGNLVLFDSNDASVWQSFEHPTDNLVPEENLLFGQKLIASISENDWSQGLISFSLTSEGIVACIESNLWGVLLQCPFLAQAEPR